jgi:hypothetical protein
LDRDGNMRTAEVFVSGVGDAPRFDVSPYTIENKNYGTALQKRMATFFAAGHKEVHDPAFLSPAYRLQREDMREQLRRELTPAEDIELRRTVGVALTPELAAATGAPAPAVAAAAQAAPARAAVAAAPAAPAPAVAAAAPAAPAPAVAAAAPAARAPAVAPAVAPAAPAVRAGTLVKGASAAVYIIDASSQKRGIASGEVFQGCGLDWGKVQTLPEAQISQMPTGTMLATAQACQQVVAPATGAPAPAAAAAPAGDPRLVILDPVFYLGKYPDLKQAFGNSVPAAQKHWLDTGIRQGRQSSAAFDLRTYLARYADLQKAFGGDFGAALNHWLQSGQREGRSAAPQGSILRDAATGATSFVDRDGRKRGISTPQLFAECGLDWNNASNVTKDALDSVPAGPNFSSAAECQAARR